MCFNSFIGFSQTGVNLVAIEQMHSLSGFPRHYPPAFGLRAALAKGCALRLPRAARYARAWTARMSMDNRPAAYVGTAYGRPGLWPSLRVAHSLTPTFIHTHKRDLPTPTSPYLTTGVCFLQKRPLRGCYLIMAIASTSALQWTD